MKLDKKRYTLNGYTLLYAILIMIIVSISFSAVLLYTKFHLNIINTVEEKIRLLDRLDCAFDYLKVAGLEEELNQKFLEENELDDVTASLNYWGAFLLAKSSVKDKNDVYSKVALMAHAYPEPIALYLVEHDQPLSLSGASKIIGNAYLPRKKLRHGFIEGVSFFGDFMIDGSTMTSSRSNLSLPESFIKHCEALFFGITEFTLENKDWPEDGWQQSFEENTILFTSQNPITIENQRFLGNVLIKSDSDVMIDSSAELEDVTIIAPRITVKSGFKGNVHLLANEALIVEAKSKLTYPSSIILYNGEEQIEDNLLKIDIESNASVEGEVILGCHSKNQNAMIAIDEGAIVYGNVYSSKKVELRGTVNGSIRCDRFILNSTSSIYENYILNGIVKAFDKEDNYLGFNWPESQDTKSIAKWLN